MGIILMSKEEYLKTKIKYLDLQNNINLLNQKAGMNNDSNIYRIRQDAGMQRLREIRQDAGMQRLKGLAGQAYQNLRSTSPEKQAKKTAEAAQKAATAKEAAVAAEA